MKRRQHRPKRWERGAGVRPRVRALRARYTSSDVDEAFEVGYSAGEADATRRTHQRDNMLSRLSDAIEDGPEAVDALAREVGAIPPDEVVDVDELDDRDWPYGEPACPTWCVVDHQAVPDDPMRQCHSIKHEILTLTRRIVDVCAIRIADPITGEVYDPEVRIGDNTLTVANAGALATLLLAAAHEADEIDRAIEDAEFGDQVERWLRDQG